jgi:uncharacterized BrkB/YihY/UPF0761 family membrane protein
MSTKLIKELSVVSVILAVAGLVLMFSSVAFGTSLADSWLLNKEGGFADTGQYTMVLKTYSNNFVIIGSLLFGTGLLSALFTYLSFVSVEREKEKSAL